MVSLDTGETTLKICLYNDTQSIVEGVKLVGYMVIYKTNIGQYNSNYNLCNNCTQYTVPIDRVIYTIGRPQRPPHKKTTI